jgi:zinc/manganese transport system substrate-binding protein
MQSRRLLLALAATAASGLVLAGCATTFDPGADGQLTIVASTNVYGDIAKVVAGDAAEVTSIITDVAQDPHEYEATSRDALAISKADIVVMNGGGYDEFMETILESQNSTAEVIDAVALSGLDPDESTHEHEDEHADEEHADDEHAGHDHGEFNEHVWYHLGTMSQVAHEIAHALAELDPDAEATFEDNAAAFADGITALETRASDIAAEHGGTGFALTEPVPLYLLEAAGLENRTSEEFSEAVEEGTDAPALVLEQTIALVSGDTVAFLAYNEQTVGPQTEQVLAAAESAGLPVVSFSELLPDGDDYLTWMGANLDAVETALR